MTEVTLLDGGMGQELLRLSGDAPSPLWATQVMMDHPGLVRQVHDSYRKAGARVTTTNTYAIHRDRLKRAGIEARFADLYAMALREAQDAVPPSARREGSRIAGAIGPLGASYRTDIDPPHDEAVALHLEIVQLLAAAVDVILFETVASVAQLRAVVEAGQSAGKPVWIGLTVDDDDGTRLRSGEPLADALPVAKDRAAALLANCSAPEAMPAALDILARADLPTGAYANAFTQITKDFLQEAPTVDTLTTRRDMSPANYATHAMRWLDHGATIIGGCCETGPAHIAEIAQRLKAAGHSLA